LGLKDQKHILARLLHNQEDLGNIIKPYYGEEAGTKLTALLKEHILTLVKLSMPPKLVTRRMLINSIRTGMETLMKL
jgi:hypothetical protein